MFKAFLDRLYDDGTRTLGVLNVYDCLGLVFSCRTLEPPWINNERNKSCIPVGKYELVLRTSEKFGEHFLVKNVYDRDLILIHVGNFPGNTSGCILVGSSFTDIDGDGRPDVGKSKATFERLRKILGGAECDLFVSG